MIQSVVGQNGIYGFSKRQILDSSKLKEFSDDNFRFDENGWEISKRVENAVGKRRNCSIPAIFSFSKEFSKDLYCRHVKTKAYLGKVEGSIIIQCLDCYSASQRCSKPPFAILNDCLTPFLTLFQLYCGGQYNYLCISGVHFNSTQHSILFQDTGCFQT